jgi:hypothetical protein
MVIIPRVLTNLIQDLDENNARRLALAFAERVLEVCGDVLSTAERDASSAYLSAAKNLVEGKGSISDLGNAHQAYFSVRHQHTRLSDDLTWVAATAVAVCCQRQMEEAGIIMHDKYVPSLLDVTKESQAMAGRCAGVSEDEHKDDGSAAARRARWLEAKWQLLYLIESLPFPGEEHPAI